MSHSASRPVRALLSLRYAKAGIASVVGFLILFAGLFQGRGSRGGDLGWFLGVFVVCQFFAFRALRRVRAADEDVHFEAALARREARLAAERKRTGPVLGKKCKECRQRIVVEHDGCRCDACAAALHVACRTAHRAEEHTREGAYR